MGWGVLNKIARSLGWDIVKGIVIWLMLVLFVAVVVVLVMTLDGEAQVPTHVVVEFSEAVKPATRGMHFLNYRNDLGVMKKVWLQKMGEATYGREVAPTLFACATAEFVMGASRFVDLGKNGNVPALLEWKDTWPPEATVRLVFLPEPEAQALSTTAPRQDAKTPRVRRRGSWYW